VVGQTGVGLISTHKKYSIRTFSNDAELVDERREHIVRHATKLFIKKGYHQVSMREISIACNMSVGSIYHYIGTKQDILYLIINSAVTSPQQWRDVISEKFQSQKASAILNDLIDEYYRGIDSIQDLCLFTYQQTMNLDAGAQHIIREAAEQDIAICEAILRKGIESGEFSIENPNLLAHSIIVAGHMWAVRRWYLKSRCTIDEYIKEHKNLVFSYIQTFLKGDKQKASAVNGE